jgi:curved DNA-binding protein CbpA
MLAHKDLYAELRLRPTASASEIRSAYRRAALVVHPDKGGTTTAFHHIAFAFEILSCPTSRALYDRAYSNGLRMHHRTTAGTAKTSKAAQAFHRFTPRVKRKRESTVTGAPAKCQPHASTAYEPDAEMGNAEVGSTGASAPADDDDDAAGEDPHPAPAKTRHINDALERLRAALQDLEPPQRRAQIADMPKHVRSELLAYMSHHAAPLLESEIETNTNNGKKPHKPRCKDEVWSRGTDVRAITGLHKTSYQAQLRIRNLRMYTHCHADLDRAISQQMVLIQARQAISAASEDIWNQPQEFSSIFDQALTRAETSRSELGLSVFIFMRADEWISRCTTITSPVMTLETAVAAHSRLHQARQTSWHSLRREWVCLMRQTHHAQYRQLSQAQAEAIAENARSDLLQRRLQKTVSIADHTIRRCGLVRQKALKAEAKRRQCKLRKKIAAAAAAKRRIEKRKQQEAQDRRRRWYHRVDLTMEEILQRAPSPQGRPWL